MGSSAMRNSVTHSIRYRYDFPVNLEPQIFRLQPRMSTAQRLLAFSIQIAPAPWIKIADGGFDVDAGG